MVHTPQTTEAFQAAYGAEARFEKRSEPSAFACGPTCVSSSELQYLLSKFH